MIAVVGIPTVITVASEDWYSKPCPYSIHIAVVLTIIIVIAVPNIPAVKSVVIYLFSVLIVPDSTEWITSYCLNCLGHSLRLFSLSLDSIIIDVSINIPGIYDIGDTLINATYSSLDTCRNTNGYIADSLTDITKDILFITCYKSYRSGLPITGLISESTLVLNLVDSNYA